MSDILFKSAEVLWDFLRVDHALAKSDVMLVLGNDDPRTAEHAARLYREGWAPQVVISGQEGSGTRGKYTKSEAEVFCDIMTTQGVPRDHILLETEATNTGENLTFSQNLLAENHIHPSSVIVVTKSNMELRVALTFAKQWKEAGNVKLTVTSAPLRLQDYPSPDVGSLEACITYLVETVDKLTLYAQLGHQAPVEIPAHVQEAYERITTHSIKQ